MKIAIKANNSETAKNIQAQINLFNTNYNLTEETGLLVISDNGYGKGTYNISIARKKESLLKEASLLK